MHRFGRFLAVLAVGCFVAAWLAPVPWASVLWVWTGLAFGTVAWAYYREEPGIFRKTPVGTLPPIITFLLAPYLLLYGMHILVFRLDRRHKPYTEIEPGLYLGCRLQSTDQDRVRPHEITATLDMTAECDGISFWRTSEHYRNLPTLDAAAPTLKHLIEGAQWIAEQRAAGRNVYVHCAFGHGRSATALAAYLLLVGKVQTPEEAYELLKAKRRGVKFSREQWGVLREFVAVCGE